MAIDNNQNNNYYLAIIPARGGSKRIPRKNLVLLGEKPLIAYSIEAAKKSKKISKIIVSTEDEEIAEYSRKLGLEVPFLRPKELAQDTSTQNEVILHTLNEVESQNVKIDAVVLLQPTSPFRTETHIDESIKLFEVTGADTVTSVRKSKEHPFYTWTLKNDELVPFFLFKQQYTIRQELPPAFIENGAVYVISRNVLNEGKIYGKKIVPYIMDEQSSIDIDTHDDLLHAESIINSKTKKGSYTK